MLLVGAWGIAAPDVFDPVHRISWLSEQESGLSVCRLSMTSKSCCNTDVMPLYTQQNMLFVVFIITPDRLKHCISAVDVMSPNYYYFVLFSTQQLFLQPRPKLGRCIGASVCGEEHKTSAFPAFR